MNKDRVVFKRGKDKEWRWSRIAPNGEVVGASTESYKNFGACLANVLRQSEEPGESDVEIEE